MRILIDCTGLAFGWQPTGVPRVGLNYVRYGYKWSETSGVEVLSVYIDRSKVILIREIPGVDTPEYVLSYEPVSKWRERLLWATERVLWHVARFFYRIPYHFARLLSALLRIKDAQPKIQKMLAPVHALLMWPKSAVNRLYWQLWSVDLRKDDIMVCPAGWYGVEPAEYVRIRPQIRALMLVSHDILPITFPQYYDPSWRGGFETNVRKMVELADVFIPVSKYTRQQIVETFPKASKRLQFCVAYNALDDDIARGSAAIERSENTHRIALECASPPFLMVGTIEPKKGHLLVLETLERLWSEGRTDRKLLIIGRKGWWLSEPIANRLQNSSHPDKVIWLFSASDNDVRFAYQHCHALIFASVTEGFGLPLIECASWGKPIIARHCEVTAEIIGPFATYFDGTSDDLARKILSFEDENGEPYKTQTEALNAFSWPHWCEMIPALLEQIADHSNNPLSMPHTIWERGKPILAPHARRREKLDDGNTGGRDNREFASDPAWSETAPCAEACCADLTSRPAAPVALTGPHREGEEP